MVLILAFSFQDQVEKYGAYVGFAAFIGLAVLSLLYFAQARELKRLRDWAGRAPERAAEIEARVVAQAEAALSEPEPEPEPERSGTVGPAVPIPQGENGRKPGVPTPVPMGPRPAVAMAAVAAAAAQPATVVAEPETSEEEEPATPDEAVPATAAAAAPAEAAPAAPPPGDETAADAPPPADEAAPAASPAAPEPAEPEPARSGNGVPTPPPAEIPRATPRPQPKPRPAPAAPLRATQASRSATLPPPRRTARPQREGGSRAGIYTAIGIVVLLIAIFIPVYFTVLSGDDSPDPPENSIASPGETPAGSSSGAGAAATEARPEKVVVVLNGTPIDGLASGQRDDLLAAGYVEDNIRIDNSDDQSRQDSIVLYAAEERRQGRDVARLLDITRVEAIDPETEALANSSDESGTLPADVVVVLGADKSP